MITVVIPAYNAAKYLEAAITSVTGQGYGDFELIVVDDGSTDATASIAEGYAARDRRVRVLRQTNGGVSRARNAGIEASRGEWLMFLDADDMLAPDALATLAAGTATGAQIVMGLIVKEAKQLTGGGSGRFREYGGKEMAELILRQKKWLYNCNPGGKLFARSLFEERRFRADTAFEDLDLIPRLVLSAGKVAVTRRATSYYRQHSGSFIHRLTPGRLHALDVTRRLVEDYGDEAGLGAAVRTRRFAAACNALLLLRHNDEIPGGHDNAGVSRAVDVTGRKAECREVIRAYRGEVLRHRQTRLKDRAGALLSYVPFTVLWPGRGKDSAKNASGSAMDV